jgi:phosphoglucosamine mutase
MTNYALEKLLEERGIPFERARVGDRYVLERLQSLGWVLGGENSGHLICLDRHTTGDASIAALEILSALQRHSVGLAEWLSELRRYPQILINVPLRPGADPLQSSRVNEETLRIEAELKGHGRVLLRPSGTEPIIRVMVEAEDNALAKSLAEELATTIRTVLAH